MKKAADIEEIRAELRGTMGGRDRRLIDNDADEKEEENDAYMYPGDMTLDERANFEQHIVHQKLLNGTDNKENDLREAKEKWVNL